MSFMIYDINGYIGDLATISGMKALSAFIIKEGGEEINNLLNKGIVEVTDALVEELDKLPTPDDRHIDDTLNNLKELVGECEGIIVITDGIFDPNEKIVKEEK